MTKKPKEIQRQWRSFLNSARTGLTSTVKASYSTATYHPKGKPHFYSNLELRDCGSMVDIDFGGKYTKSSRRKLQLLRDALDVIEEGLDRYEELVQSSHKKSE